MDDSHDFRARAKLYRGKGNGENGRSYDALLERIHNIETVVARIEERTQNMVTTADLKAALNDLKSDMLKWFILTLIAAIAALAGVVAIIPS